MRKLFCDGCKKEVKKSQDFQVEYWGFNGWTIIKRLDLCPRCAKIYKEKVKKMDLVEFLV